MSKTPLEPPYSITDNKQYTSSLLAEIVWQMEWEFELTSKPCSLTCVIPCSKKGSNPEFLPSTSLWVCDAMRKAITIPQTNILHIGDGSFCCLEEIYNLHFTTKTKIRVVRVQFVLQLEFYFKNPCCVCAEFCNTNFTAKTLVGKICFCCIKIRLPRHF